SLDPKPEFILLGDPVHLAWLTGFYASPFVFRTQNALALLMLTPETATLFVDNIMRSVSEEAFVDEVVSPVWYRGTESAGLRHPVVLETVRERLHETKQESIAIASCVPATLVNQLDASDAGVSSTDISGNFHELRRRKDPDEIETMRRSILAMETGLTMARQELRPGMSELDAFDIVQQAANESSGKPVIVYGDFVSGPRTEQGGGPPSSRL